MSIATLADIITKIRRLTGTANDFSLTDAQIIDYINSFYLYDFPAMFRSLKLKDRYTFNTQRGIDVYPFDSEHFTTVEGPCYCMKRAIPMYQNPAGFWGLNFNWQFQQNLTQGDGTVGPYIGILNNIPIIRSANNNPMVSSPLSSTLPFPIGNPVTFPQANIARVQNILITANIALGTTLNVTDDGNGNLIGNGIGTIDYDSGVISLSFVNPIPAGNVIQVQYGPANMNIPLSIMFYQNQFTLRPVPDQGYTIELISYRQPSQALLGSEDPDNPDTTGVPELKEWWECIAFGASKKIYEDRLDPDGVALMEKSLVQMYSVAEARTYAQIGKQSINTLFRDQLAQSYQGTGWGFGSGSGSL